MLTPDGGESREALRGRVNEALATILGDGRTWLVVSHGGPIRMAIEVLLGVPVGRLSPVAPASATVLDLDDPPRLLAYNLTPRHAPGDVPSPGDRNDSARRARRDRSICTSPKPGGNAGSIGSAGLAGNVALRRRRFAAH